MNSIGPCPHVAATRHGALGAPSVRRLPALPRALPRALAVAVALSLAMTGCGGNGASPPAAPAPSSSTIPVAAGTSTAPTADGTPTPLPASALHRGSSPMIDVGEFTDEIATADPQHQAIRPPGTPTGPSGLPAYDWAYRASNIARCGNGSATGYAVNHYPGAQTLLLYLQGGGACWNGLTCFGLKASKPFLSTLQQTAVLAQAHDPRMAPLFDRARPGSIFAPMTHVYVPYCTGDLHTGTRVQTHQWFGNKPAYHVGARNLEAFLDDLVPLVPEVKRVILVGASAGGFGATFNWWRVRAAFGPAVRVDVVDDSGPPIDPSTTRLWNDMRDAWGLQVPLDCPECRDAPSHWLPYYARTVPAPARYGLVAYEGDDTIGSYGVLSDPLQQRRLNGLRNALGARQRMFTLPGDEHVALDASPWPTARNGVTLAAWLQAFYWDDPRWANAGP